MFGLEYGSDDDESENESPTVKPPPSTTPAASSSTTAPAATKTSSSGLQLPPPTSKTSRRKDGPVKIKIDALQPSASDEPLSKKPRIEGNVPVKGAGSSSLVGMLSKLPAPKVAPVPQPAKKTRVLGGGVSSGDNPGVIMDSHEDSGWNTGAFDEDDSASSSTSFLPPSLKAKSSSSPASAAAFAPPSLKAKAPAANASVIDKSPVPVAVKNRKPAAVAVDFFGLGPTSTPISSSTPSTSASVTPTPSVTISSAPKVVEYEPPPPSMTDPYPGYYQKPSGDWAAYDPAYYKSFWETWNTDAASNVGLGGHEKGKRKDRGWEGSVDEDSLMDVNASEEMKKSQVAAREAAKNLTAAPTPASAQAKPNMNMKVKAGGGARKKGQLSSLLAEAYENREAIEARLAEGRRNRKEAGHKYGF